jgi:hypothetical protein
MLIEASSIQSIIAAIQRAVEFGMVNNASDASIDPMKKKGLRLPH